MFVDSFPRGWLEENCELWGTDYVQVQIPEHILCQIETIVFIILQRIFCNTRGFKNYEISLGYSPVFAGEYLVTWHV